MSAEKHLRRETLFRGRVVTLHVDTVSTPSEKETTREIVEHADCIVVVPVDKDGNILLVRQYRTPVKKELLELPAGGIDPGETPEEAVRRELQEEIGFLPQRLERLGGFYAAPGYCTEYLYLYLARDLAPQQLRAEDTDAITVVPVAAAEIEGLISSGMIEDAKSIAGLLTYLKMDA